MSRATETAVILAVGTELTTGSTRDTNSGELARELTGRGVAIRRTMALPDDLDLVTRAFSDALAEADLVISTGGLGPTPDDLTREAIAAACGLEPHVDTETERWLRAMFARRKLSMPDTNLKQAWLIEGAESLPNAHGTAPGWWVARPDGRVIVALPGPPREMWPIWQKHALPRLLAGQLGVERATHILRLTGIGESALVGLIGEDVLRVPNPQVATYARADAVDLVVSAVAVDGRTADGMVADTIASLRERVGEYVFAEGDAGWPEVLAGALGGRTLAIVEAGTGGQLAALIGGEEFLVHGELVREIALLSEAAEHARVTRFADIGLAVEARTRSGDTGVRVAIAGPDGIEEHERTAFLGGAEGSRRAAIAACAVVWRALTEKGRR